MTCAHKKQQNLNGEHTHTHTHIIELHSKNKYLTFSRSTHLKEKKFIHQEKNTFLSHSFSQKRKSWWRQEKNQQQKTHLAQGTLRFCPTLVGRLSHNPMMDREKELFPPAEIKIPHSRHEKVNISPANEPLLGEIFFLVERWYIIIKYKKQPLNHTPKSWILYQVAGQFSSLGVFEDLPTTPSPRIDWICWHVYTTTFWSQLQDLDMGNMEFSHELQSSSSTNSGKKWLPNENSGGRTWLFYSSVCRQLQHPLSPSPPLPPKKNASPQ